MRRRLLAVADLFGTSPPGFRNFPHATSICEAQSKSSSPFSHEMVAIRARPQSPPGRSARSGSDAVCASDAGRVVPARTFANMIAEVANSTL